MLSSRGGGENNLSNISSSKSSSSSYSSSSSSPSPSPFSSLTLHPHPNPRAKTMEEVWKDINLASLHDQYPSREDSHTTITNFRGGGTILQDFLARPFSKEPPTSVPPRGGYGSPAPLPVPTTALSLNSSPDQFHFLGNSDPHSSNFILPSHPVSNVCPLNVPFDALPAPSSLPALGKKRVPESDNNSGDRRHKRMIKNRESAARSRARKQEFSFLLCTLSTYPHMYDFRDAYTNELELEVAHLMEENARLREQQQQLCLAAAAQLPKKQSLHRTSTAPF
ncbi:hypothetical protein F0562_006847 [Nyssa sinensis]|uniref:BZIP domain-containing protein n=1 Tax=Nyssa sinensis TaxID=561372 RepID=A0A5J5ASJ2_9ASTE|nr:hypothetical protein F0562_006847 [Nyssa sinensis]